jgi:hypothetical protein
MRDFDSKTQNTGYVSTVVADIWKSDKRLKTLFSAIEVYCQLRVKDITIITIHIAEYRALSKLANRLSRQLYRTGLHNLSDDRQRITKEIYALAPEKQVMPILENNIDNRPANNIQSRPPDNICDRPVNNI